MAKKPKSAFDAGLKEALGQLLEEIQVLYRADSIPWVVGYSGGKDSTAVLQLVWHALADLPDAERSKPVHVISTDTLVENPIVASWVSQSPRKEPLFRSMSADNNSTRCPEKGFGSAALLSLSAPSDLARGGILGVGILALASSPAGGSIMPAGKSPRTRGRTCAIRIPGGDGVAGPGGL